MDRFRIVVEWLGRHKIFSGIALLIAMVVSVALRHASQVSNGTLSAPLHRGEITDAVYGIGTVTPYHRMSYNPLVGSTLEKIFVAEGDLVAKGTPLLRAMEGITLRAPFDGTVNFLPYKVGENVYSSAPMMILTDMTHLYVVVSMEQQGALRVKPGQAAKISFDSIRDRTFEGKVSAVYSYSSNFLARIDGVNFPASILPDMTCDVAIVIGVHKSALLIPLAAFEDGRVFVKRGRALPRAVAVTVGVTDGTWAEVSSGDLESGDRVLIRKQVPP